MSSSISTSSTPVWLITGTSTGIGRSTALAALARGHRVIATGRSISRLQELKEAGAAVLEVDVNADEAEIRRWAQVTALRVYGRVDMLVNNAGFVGLGTVEESGHDKLVKQYHTNVFAVMNVTRAFLPAMRKQGGGTIFMIGSVAAFQYIPAAGLYDSSKAALRGLTHALAAEVKSQNIRVCHIEPGMFRTAVFSSLGTPEQNQPDPDLESGPHLLSAYADVRKGTLNFFRGENSRQIGDPDKLGNVLVDLVTGEGVARGRPWPNELAVGSDCVKIIREILEEDLRRLRLWEEVSVGTDGDWIDR